MNIEAIKQELNSIGSEYIAPRWKHKDPVRGKELVGLLVHCNKSIKRPERPTRHGPRGEFGTITCISCGKRGQEHGTVCDHCDTAL